MPANAQLANSITIFVSYVPQDSDILEQLKGHLSMLKPLIALWYDRKMEPGSNREEEIERQLNAAQIILLLISKDFLASGECQQQAERAMSQSEQQGRVIPILARACNWKNAPYGNLQPLPVDGKPLGSRSQKDRDSALADIAAYLQNRIHQTVHYHIPKKHRNLRAKPLYPHPEIILQREELVKEICERLTGDNITALVLTDMVGIGKTTLSGQFAAIESHEAFHLLLAQFADVVGQALRRERSLLLLGDPLRISAFGQVLCHLPRIKPTNSIKATLLNKTLGNSFIDWPPTSTLSRYSSTNCTVGTSTRRTPGRSNCSNSLIMPSSSRNAKNSSSSPASLSSCISSSSSPA